MEELGRRLQNILEKVDLKAKKEELSELEKKTYDPEFWKNLEESKTVSQRIKQVCLQLKELS